MWSWPFSWTFSHRKDVQSFGKTYSSCWESLKTGFRRCFPARRRFPCRRRPFSSGWTSNGHRKSQKAFFLSWDWRDYFCHLLRTWSKDGLTWPSASWFGIFSRCRFGGFLSVRNGRRSVIVLMKSRASGDRWRIGRIGQEWLQKRCWRLRSGNLFIIVMCRRLRILSFWRCAKISLKEYVHVVVLFGVLLSSHKEHVLQIMSETLSFPWIKEGSDADT